ncbi:MAG: glycoside hydrolase family 97 N-terminal domain-containing protein [Bacteroidetes bacterium]|nr:glycoside hydrolase family 97 N-terminal domain-containing protein [Bacteroidota bacterium]
MSKSFRTFLFLVVISLSCQGPEMNYQVIIPSPNQELRLYFAINEGEAYYLIRKSEIIIGWSRLGLILNETKQHPLVYHQSTSTRQGITNGVGKDFDPVRDFPEPYNETEIELLSSSGDFQYYLQFRVSGNGVAFRYKIPGAKHEKVTEITRFVLHPNNENWHQVIPMDSTITALDDQSQIALPVVFQADKQVTVKISEWPPLSDPNNLIAVSSEKDTYQIKNSHFIPTDDLLYSAWHIIRIGNDKTSQME